MPLLLWSQPGRQEVAQAVQPRAQAATSLLSLPKVQAWVCGQPWRQVRGRGGVRGASRLGSLCMLTLAPGHWVPVKQQWRWRCNSPQQGPAPLAAAPGSHAWRRCLLSAAEPGTCGGWVALGSCWPRQSQTQLGQLPSSPPMLGRPVRACAGGGSQLLPPSFYPVVTQTPLGPISYILPLYIHRCF